MMKKNFLVLFIVALSACSYINDFSKKMSEYSVQQDAIGALDYKYVFRSEQKHREKVLQDLMHKYTEKSKEALEYEYIIKPIDTNQSWEDVDMYGGVKPVLHGRTCSIMKNFILKAQLV